MFDAVVTFKIELQDLTSMEHLEQEVVASKKFWLSEEGQQASLEVEIHKIFD